MLTPEDDDLLTRIGLEPDRPPRRVRLLGEPLAVCRAREAAR